MASASPLASTPTLAGDPSRQALASLGGYLYQIYASCAAWLDLDQDTELHLEVAEDYATVLKQAVSAVQVKATNDSLTILNSDVLATIDNFVYLVTHNPGYNVTMRHLTTAQVGLERDHKHQVGGRPALEAWSKAAANQLAPADLATLVAVLKDRKLHKDTLQFIASRSPAQLQADLFSRISWDAGRPSRQTLARRCRDKFIELAAAHPYEVPAREAFRLVSVVLQKVFDTALDPASRVLTRADLKLLLEDLFAVSLPRAQVGRLLAMLPGQSAHGPAPDRAFDRLRELSAGFADEADIAGSTLAGAPLRLSDGLFVPRDQGTRLIDSLRRPTADEDAPLSVVVGDAGHGKTSLLWWLHRALRDDRKWLPLFFPATFLTAPGAGTDEVEAACRHIRTTGKAPLILIDTVDLLLRDEDGAVRFTERLAALLAANAHVVLGTRPLELGRIDQDRFPYRCYRLGKYSDSELESALAFHAARYGDTDSDFPRIRSAIALRQPLKDVCAIPLALRLLFEVYSPSAVQADINVFGLYCAYWEHRVQSDRRGTGLVTDAAPPGGRDCSALAAWLALSMLAEGTLDLDLANVRRTLAWKRYPVGLLHDLLHRGVLQAGNGRTVRFFHQTLFEHAAARGLVMFLKEEGISLLSTRCLAHPDDLFLKPVLEQVLLLAEIEGGAAEASAWREFDHLLTSPDLADQCIALDVHCHAHHGNDNRAYRVNALLCHADTSERILVHFLSHAANLPDRRLAELAPLWKPLWARPGHRIRTHLLQLLRRIASRKPALVLPQVTALGLHDYVFTVNRGRDDVVNDYVELLGNLALADAGSAPTVCGFLGAALDAALAAGPRFGCAARVVAIVAQLDDALVDAFLHARQSRHAEWDEIVVKIESSVFMEPYVRLRVGRIAAGATLADLLDAVPTVAGADLFIGLAMVDRYMQVHATAATPALLTDLEHRTAPLAPALRIAWARLVIGPLLGRAARDPQCRPLACQTLETALDDGIAAFRRQGQGRLDLGLATRMIRAATLPANESADLFARLPGAVTTAEWIGVPELAPFLLAMTTAGLPDARAAYDSVLAQPGAHPRAATALQSQLATALRDGPDPARLADLVVLVNHTGRAGWLKEALPHLTAAAHADQAFGATLQDFVRKTLTGPSGSAGSSVVQLLPALVAGSVIDPPGIDEGLAWLDAVREPNARLHLAAWLADAVCGTKDDGTRLLAWLDRHVRPLLQGAKIPLFPKEQYLKSCAALVRRELLDPHAPVPSLAETTWAEELLRLTLKDPVLENHMTWFGWTISSVAATSPAHAAGLFQRLVDSEEALAFGQSSQRNLSRHLMTALHTVFYGAGTDVRAELLQFARKSDVAPLIARSIIQIALECNDVALNPTLAALRTDDGFDADLRNLITRYRRHNPLPDALNAWDELRDRISRCALPLPARA